MPRKFFKKYMPDQHLLRSHRSLRWLGTHLHDPNLWHLTRKSVSRAFLVGVFCAFLPIPGQMIVAAALALLCTSNLAISIGLVWLTNPLTMPPVFVITSYSIHYTKLYEQAVRAGRVFGRRQTHLGAKGFGHLDDTRIIGRDDHPPRLALAGALINMLHHWLTRQRNNFV